jgi:hypothetical protein
MASYAADCRAGSNPLRAPMPCTSSRSFRLAVIFASFWRRLPAAALRGLANGAFSCATSDSFSSVNAATGK